MNMVRLFGYVVHRDTSRDGPEVAVAARLKPRLTAEGIGWKEEYMSSGWRDYEYLTPEGGVEFDELCGYYILVAETELPRAKAILAEAEKV